MLLKELVERRACRNFDPDRPVEKEKIEAIVEAGLRAPTGMNVQDTCIIVITDKVKRDALSIVNAKPLGWDRDPFYGAPVVLLVMAKPSPFAEIDGGATMENLLIEATHQGLGSCWIHRAKEELESEEGQKLFASWGIDVTGYVGIGHAVIGYSKGGKVPEKVIKDGRVFYTD